MKTFWNTAGGVSQIREWQPNCWIQVTCPTEEDQDELEKKFGIPDYFFPDISDADERARYEYDDGWMLIILRIPYVKEVRSEPPTPLCRWVSSTSATSPSPCATTRQT